MEQKKGKKFVGFKSYSDMCLATLQKMQTYKDTDKQKYISSYESRLLGDMATELEEEALEVKL
jgi:hypothetical protein